MHEAVRQTDTLKALLKKKYANTTSYEQQERDFQAAPGTVFPDSVLLNPFHYLKTRVYLDTTDIEFESISVEVHVKTHVPNNYTYYISPLCANINKMPFYCGLISGKAGKRDALFDRWMERDIAAVRTTGSAGSNSNEGDYIGMSTPFQWDTGRYIIRLSKTGYIPGKPVPKEYTDKTLMFSWGEYEHSWVTMIVEDPSKHITVTIGSLAFPGRKLWYSSKNLVFLEHYGSFINFASKAPQTQFAVVDHEDLPVISLEVGNFMVNGMPTRAVLTETLYSQVLNPGQKTISMKIPVLAKADYDKSAGYIRYMTGRIVSW